MPDSRPLSSGLVAFTTESGEEFRLDVVEAVREQQRIGDRCRADNLSNFQHLDMLAAWVAGKTGAVLSPGQADHLWDELPRAYELFRQRRAATSDGAPQSPTSTGSTPAASPSTS